MSRKMKDSGIEWIGEIPESWNVTAHKWVMKKKKELCEKYCGEDIISLTMKGVIKRDLINPSGKMPATFDGYQKVSKGNLLLCLFDIDVTPRCTGLIKDDGLTSPAYSQFELISDNYAPYYNYLLQTIDDRKEFLHLSKNLRSSLTEADFGSIKTINPPLQQQKTISMFLDYTLPKIDSIIERTKETINGYKSLKQSIINEAVMKGLNKDVEMKDSGDEWIGEIPKSWEIKKMKYCGELSSSGVDKKIREGEPQYKSVHYMDVYKGSLGELSNSEEYLVISAAKDKALECSLRRGDILITNSSETAEDMGHSTLIKEDLDNTLFGYHLMRFRPMKEFHPEFLKFLIGGSYLRNWFSFRSNGITRYGITYTGFSEAKLIVPPIEDQIKIAKELDYKCAKINSLILQKQKLIEDMEIYKKSLIYECVTGKREIN